MQQRADEAALRKLLIHFLISRMDAKNALAVWDLGDRAGSAELSEAAFAYVQRQLQVVVSASDGFWDLPFSHVLRLITADNLTLFNEPQAVELLCQWVHVDDLRRAQPEVFRFKARVAELESLRSEVCPQMRLRLQDDETSAEVKGANAGSCRVAFEAAKKRLEDEHAVLEKARMRIRQAQQRLAAARKALPKPKQMKLRFFNMDPPDVVRRVMCGVGVLLRIPGDLLAPPGGSVLGSSPSSPRSSPRKLFSRGSREGESLDRTSITPYAHAPSSLELVTPSSARRGADVSAESGGGGGDGGGRHGVDLTSNTLSLTRDSILERSHESLDNTRESGGDSPVTPSAFLQLSMQQALKLYNEASLPSWLRQIDAAKLTPHDCKELRRFTKARDYDPEVLKKRLGGSKQEIPLAVCSFVLAVEDLATWSHRAQQHQANIAVLDQELEEATDRLCDAESELERMRQRVTQCRKELIEIAGDDAMVDMQLELSFQRLIQGNEITRRRLVLLLRKVRWAMVPEAYVSTRLQQHPLVLRFRERPDLQRELERAAETPRVSLCEASYNLKDAYGQRLVRATLASSLDADIASVLQRQSAGEPAGVGDMSGGDRSGGYGAYGGAREKMIGLSWSRHVIAHELRCQGDYGGFLGTTETGCSVVVGPRPGSGAARSGGVSGRLGDTVLFLMGGLGVDGIATRYVRMFVPDLGGGSWKECAPLGEMVASLPWRLRASLRLLSLLVGTCVAHLVVRVLLTKRVSHPVHTRAFAAAAFLPAPARPTSENSQLALLRTQQGRPATTSSLYDRNTQQTSNVAVRNSLSSLPKPGHASARQPSRHPPPRLVLVGGVSDSQRFLKTAEVLDLSGGGLQLLSPGNHDTFADTRREAEEWRFRQTLGSNGGGGRHSGQWELIGCMRSARSLAQVLLVEGSLYVAGGLSEDRNPVRTVERLRPSFAASWLRNSSNVTGEDEPRQPISHERVEAIPLAPPKGGVFGDAPTDGQHKKRRPASVGFASVHTLQQTVEDDSERQEYFPVRILDGDGQPKPLPMSAGVQRPGGSATAAVDIPDGIRNTGDGTIRPWSRTSEGGVRAEALSRGAASQGGSDGAVTR